MPITLVTGTPGAGKTLYTISRWKPIGEKEGRAIFYAGIKDLKLQWQEWETEKWQDLPPGAIFIIDEAQFKLKVHGRGQLPDWIEKLAVHRHQGLDIVLITQSPMSLDPFVRRLIDRHFHVSRKFGLSRAVVHEFPTGCQDNVAKVRKDSIRHDWVYPKEAYAWYKSAEVHTVKPRLPAKFWLLVGCAVAFVVVAPFAYRSITNPYQGKATATVGTGGTAVPGAPGASAAGSGGGVRRVMTAGEYAAAYQPRIEGLPHTAPVYDNVTQPAQAPYPAACLANAHKCQCYSQQGTRLDVQEQLCRQLADGGFFVAWNANGDRVQRQPEQQRPRDRLQLEGGGGGMGSFGPSAPRFVAQAVDEDAGNLPRRVRRAAQ